MSATRVRTILSLFAGIFLCIVASTSSASAQNAASAPKAITLPGLGAADAAVGGTWQFHTGDDMAWASPTLDDSGWQPISVTESWGAQTKFPNHFNYIGMAWYRRHIDIPAVAGAPPDLALYLPRVDDAYEVYWNGALVGSFGQLPPDAVAYSAPPPHTFGLGPARSGVLAIRVWKAPPESFSTGEDGGLTGAPRIGSPEAVASLKGSYDYNWLHSRQVVFGTTLLYALVAVLGLIIWLNDRRQKVILWTALFALAPVCQILLLTLRTPLPYRWALGMMQPFVALPDISLWFLLLYLFDLEKHGRLRRSTYILAWVEMIVQALEGLLTIIQYSFPRATVVADTVLTAIFTPLTLFALVLVGYILAHPRRLDYSRWMVAVFALLSELFTTFRIAVSQGARYTHWTIAAKISQPLFLVRGNPIGVRTLLSSGLIVSIVYAVYRFQAEHRERQNEVEREFLSAQELQRVLIPEDLPTLPGYAITSSYIPAQQVGGDFFQLIPLADRAALVMIGDVSGKGLKAAMTVSLIIGTTRTLAEFLTDPAELLAGLNRRLHGRLSGGFVTCLMLRVEADGACQIASAGHLPPVRNGSEIALPPALPLGILLDADYEPFDFKLDAGDRLMLYTDGLLEARDAHGELFGFDRVAATATAHATASATVEASGEFSPDDDITVMTITRIAAGVEATSSYHAPTLVETVA
jgi:hypothetical protein